MVTRRLLNQKTTIAWGLVLLFFLPIGCTPSLTIKPIQNLEPGQVKTLEADVWLTPCTGKVTPYFKKAHGSTDWLPSGPLIVSGITYCSEVPGSAQFTAGETYDFEWVIVYEDYFPPPIKWIIGPCGLASKVKIWSSSFTVAGSSPSFTLTISPDPLSIVQGSSSTLTVGVIRSGGFTGPVSVSFSNLPSGVTASPSTLNITGTSGTASISATSTAVPGQYTVTADGSSGTLTRQKTFTVSIVAAPSPSFTLTISPDPLSIVQGSSSTVTVGVIRSGGFAGPVSVSFSNLPSGVTASPSTLNITGTSGTASISATSTAVPGQYTVTANGSSGTLTRQKTFTVHITTPVPAIVFRSSASDVQSFDFSNPANPSTVDTKPATPSGGGLSSVVGLSYNGAGYLIRSGTSDVQAFSVSAAHNLILSSTQTTVVSPTGVNIWATGNRIIRASDQGIQAFELTSGSLQARGTRGATTSTTGVGVDAFGNTAVRAHVSGINVFNITDLNAISLVGNSSGASSSTGVDVKVYSAGTRAVRVYNQGIEIYSISPPSSISRIGWLTTVASSTGVAVAVNEVGNRAVRAYNGGIEVFDISDPTNMTRLGYKTGMQSSTGVDVYLVGDRAYRATNSTIEVYDISSPSNIMLLGTVPATASSTGVGLSGQ